MDNTPVDLSLYLHNDLVSRASDLLYRWFFQPITDMMERFSRRWTKRWCEKKFAKPSVTLGH